MITRDSPKVNKLIMIHYKFLSFKSAGYRSFFEQFTITSRCCTALAQSKFDNFSRRHILNASFTNFFRTQGHINQFRYHACFPAMLSEENHHCINQWASWQNISFIIVSIIAMLLLLLLLLSLIFSLSLFHHFYHHFFICLLIVEKKIT